MDTINNENPFISLEWHNNIKSFMRDKHVPVLNGDIPKFFIPSEKISLLFDWFKDNQDNITDIFPIYNDYCLVIEAKDILKINKPTLLNLNAFNTPQDLQDAIKLVNYIEDSFSYMQLHIKHKNDKTLFELYDVRGKLIGVNEINENKTSDNFYYNKDILDVIHRTDYSVFNKLMIEISLIGYFDINENVKNLINSLFYICNMLFISSNYYINQYTKNNNISITQVREKLQIECKTSPSQDIKKYKVLTKPFYDIGKLNISNTKRSSNIEHSSPNHAFRVQGHWRHYRNGKTVFIESYIKCKDKGNLINDVILKPRKRG